MKGNPNCYVRKICKRRKTGSPTPMLFRERSPGTGNREKGGPGAPPLLAISPSEGHGEPSITRRSGAERCHGATWDHRGGHESPETTLACPRAILRPLKGVRGDRRRLKQAS